MIETVNKACKVQMVIIYNIRVNKQLKKQKRQARQNGLNCCSLKNISLLYSTSCN